MLQTFNVPAGGRQIDAKANFFRYESSDMAGADETIRVRVDGSDLGTYLPGDSIRLPVDGKRWEVTPASGAQTCIVRLGLGQIETARLVGIVAITNKIGSGITQVEGSNPLPIGINVMPIVAPAGNPRGLIVRRVFSQGQAGAGGALDMRVIAAPVQPVSSVPTNAYNLCGAYSSGAVSSDAFSNQNYQLPAGWGVWAYSNAITAAAVLNGWGLHYEPL